jgi:hypothetical protein
MMKTQIVYLKFVGEDGREIQMPAAEKEKWYKKSEPVVEMKSYNPYTSIPYLNNVVVKQPKSHWLLSKPAMFVYGIATGLVISK